MLIAILALVLIAAPAVNAAAVDWDAATTVTTRNLDGSTNSWNQADLLEALGLINRKYRRDMQTLEGRKAWHGNVVIERDMEKGITIERYDDGLAITNEWKTATSPMKANIESAAERARKRNAGKPPEVVELFAARAAAEEDKTTKTVTVDLATGKEVEP